MKEGVYVKKYISSRFQGVEGGLFTKVTKADVGDNFASMEGEVVLMGWADPFIRTHLYLKMSKMP